MLLRSLASLCVFKLRLILFLILCIIYRRVIVSDMHLSAAFSVLDVNGDGK